VEDPRTVIEFVQKNLWIAGPDVGWAQTHKYVCSQQVPVEKPIMSQKVIEEGMWGLNKPNAQAASWSKCIRTQLNFLGDIIKYIHTQCYIQMGVDNQQIVSKS
jgi:hypothetical protein